MIKNRKKLEELERRLAKTENLSYQEALVIYDALYKEAVALGAIDSENILDGLDADIRLAKALNSLK